MVSKTPIFDKALDEILKNLVPHERVCGQCKQSFKVEKEDIDFYKMLRVPPPKKCPNCRQRNRRAFINYTTIFKRSCSAPGHSEKIISQVPENSAFPVYDFDYYWSGEWDPLSYGREYDPDASFFDQFRNLLDRVPQPASTRDPMSVNSEYTTYGIQLKNCYYVFGGLSSENVSYSNWPIRTKDSLEILVSRDSERCYEVIEIDHCYNCRFVYFSGNCLDSDFLYDCQNCDHCFGCVNLRNKKYHFFNKPLSKEEYEKKKREIDLGDREIIVRWQKEFEEFLEKSPKRITFNVRTVNSVGNFLKNCEDCYHCFFLADGQHNRYTEIELGCKDSMDLLLGGSPSKCYETVSPYDGSGLRFSTNCRGECLDSEYSLNIKDSSDCFGCIGMENKRFCIFNKQFSEEEYWLKVDEIKTAMLERGEYGEFFPMSFSPFPYNSTIAHLSFPITEKKAAGKNLWWQEPQTSEFSGRVLSKNEIPKNIRDVKDDILDGAVRCEVTEKPFRIIREELEFYRRQNLPIPMIHPAERLRSRFSWMGFFNFAEADCVKCGSKIIGNISKNFDKNIYCQSCYNKEII